MYTALIIAMAMRLRGIPRGHLPMLSAA